MRRAAGQRGQLRSAFRTVQRISLRDRPHVAIECQPAVLELNHADHVRSAEAACDAVEEGRAFSGPGAAGGHPPAEHRTSDRQPELNLPARDQMQEAVAHVRVCGDVSNS